MNSRDFSDNTGRADGTLAVLRDLRPTDARIDAEFTPAARDALRDRILSGDSNRDSDSTAGASGRVRHLPRRRRLAIGAGLTAAAAAAVVAGVVLPSGTPGGPDPAAAKELRRLAVVAGQHGATAGKGQYAYTALVEEQTSEPGSELAPDETRVGDVARRPRRDRWLAPSGVSFTKIGDRSCLTKSKYTGADAGRGVYEDLTAAQLASLPTDTERLAEFIDDHPAGDNRGSHNRFLVVGDLVRSGLASPQLRAAALRVLATTDGVTVRTGGRDDRNRPATIASQRDGDSTEQVLFDPATSAVLEQRQTLGDTSGHYSGVFLANRVVDRLPDLPACAADASDPTHGHGG